jgi:hypothetical protein
MKRIIWLAASLLLLFVLGCADDLPSVPAKAVRPDLEGERVSALLVSLRARQSRIVALCDLASKAGPAFPKMASQFLSQALDTARSFSDPQTLEMASELRVKAAHGNSAAGMQSREVDQLIRAAWPLALVARVALVVDLDLAARALDLGLERAKANPETMSRDRDLAELAMVMGRTQADQARQVAEGIKDPLARARAWRGLAELTRQAQDLTMAARADELVAEPGAGALSLTHTAAQAYGWDADQGKQLFERAFAMASKAEPAKRRALLQAEVAADMARLDPRAGFDLARRVEPGQGVRFKPLRIVARALLASNPILGRQVMDAAIREASDLPLSYERHRAMGLLSADLAQYDPPAAMAILSQVPEAEYLLRAGAEAAMVLAQAAKNFDQAAVLAQAIGDNYVRLGVLARLADIAMASDPARGRALYQRVLGEAARMGSLLPRRALIRAWAALDAETAIRLAGEISQPVARTQTLVILAKFLYERGNNAGAQWCLQLALETIKLINVQETLDKVRLLGDMGREWSVIEPGQARRYFALGAEAAKELG